MDGGWGLEKRSSGRAREAAAAAANSPSASPWAAAPQRRPPKPRRRGARAQLSKATAGGKNRGKPAAKQHGQDGSAPCPAAPGGSVSRSPPRRRRGSPFPATHGTATLRGESGALPWPRPSRETGRAGRRAGQSRRGAPRRRHWPHNNTRAHTHTHTHTEKD